MVRERRLDTQCWQPRVSTSPTVVGGSLPAKVRNMLALDHHGPSIQLCNRFARAIVLQVVQRVG